MRVVVVSMVKNEADVIEAFCRHVAAFADRHLVFDHQSTDGTPFLLHRLVREGLPITLFTDDRVEYLQAERTTELMRRAVRDFAADWVVPLDADEFPQPGPPGAFRSRLEQLLSSGRPLRLWLRDYAPHPADDPGEPNPVLRLRHRFPLQSAGKVIVPRPLAADPAVTLSPGNHELLRNSHPIDPVQLEDVWLAHFPGRTAGQVVGKIVLNELQRLAGGASGGGGTHLRRHFDRLLVAPGMYFDTPCTYLRGEYPDPAVYWGGPVRYKVPVGEWERAAMGLLSFAERLAASHGRHRDEGSLRVRPVSLRERFRNWVKPAVPAFQQPAFRLREGVPLPDSRTSTAAGCEIDLLSADADAHEVRFAVRVRNVGLCLWRAGQPGEAGAVNLGVQYYIGGRLSNPNFRRHPIPTDMEPGDAATLDVAVPRPHEPGGTFRLDMVAEGVTWFDHVGCEIDIAAADRRRSAA